MYNVYVFFTFEIREAWQDNETIVQVFKRLIQCDGKNRALMLRDNLIIVLGYLNTLIDEME